MAADFYKKIAEQEGVKPNDSDITLLNDTQHKVGVLDNKPKLGTKVTDLIKLNIDRVLENNPILHPHASELVESLVESTTNESTKEMIRDVLKEITKKYQPQQEQKQQQEQPQQEQKQQQEQPQQKQEQQQPQPHFKVILDDLTKLSTDVKFSKAIGPKNSKEFTDKITTLNAQYQKASIDNKGTVFL